MSHQLQKPYTDEERADFIVTYNHQQGLYIEETDDAIFAFEPWEKLVDGKVVDNTEEYEAEQVQKERQRLDMLSMTKREMFLGLYQAKQITPDMLKAQIIDPQALIEFEYANDYYRGNVLIDQVGAQLGITSEQLDKFFNSKDYHYLTTCTLTVNVVPEEATVIINDVEQKQITVPYGASVDVSVECNGYIGTAYTAFLTEDKTLDIELDKEVEDENTTNTDELPNEVGTEKNGTEEADTDTLSKQETVRDTADTGLEATHTL